MNGRLAGLLSGLKTPPGWNWDWNVMDDDECDSDAPMELGLQSVELTDLNGDLARQTVEIYQDAFPPEERDSLETIAAEVRRRVRPNEILHWWAYMENGVVVGTSLFSFYPAERLGYLQYIAVRRGQRGHGYGARFLQMVLDQLRRDAAQAGTSCWGLCLEVEQPDGARSAEEREMRLARIRFYERSGAVLLSELDYVAPPVAPGLPALPYYLMFVPEPGKRYPIGRSFLRRVIEAVLVRGNHVPRSSTYFQRASASLQRFAPQQA